MLVSKSVYTLYFHLNTPFLGFFKGTSADQDRRFSDKELKLLKTMKFPAEFDKKASFPPHRFSVL